MKFEPLLSPVLRAESAMRQIRKCSENLSIFNFLVSLLLRKYLTVRSKSNNFRLLAVEP